MEFVKKNAKRIRNSFREVHAYLKAKPHLQVLLVFTFFCLVFLWMYMTVGQLISNDDHYFHFRFADLMKERGFFPMFNDFKGVYFSPMTTGEFYPTYNFLFYLFIIPLTYIEPLYLAIKLYAVIAAAFLFTLFYICCRWYGVKYSFLWTIAIVGFMGIDSIGHLFPSRPYVLAPILLLVLLFTLKDKKYGATFILSLVYFFWHNTTFWFPLLIAGTFYIFEKFYYYKPDWKGGVACLGGTVSAIVLTTIIARGFITYQLKSVSAVLLGTLHTTSFFIPVGGELYPKTFFNYITSNVFIFSIFAIVVCYEIAEYMYFRKKLGSTHSAVHTTVDPRQPLKMTVFFISILFFLGTIRISGRFNDFFIIFVGFYIVASASMLFANVQFTVKHAYNAVVTGLVIVVIALFSNNVLQIQTFVASAGSSPEVFEGVGKWLKTNTQKGDLIFNPNWSWFPQLYYYSPDNYYVAGMEPRVFYETNQTLYWKWLNISYRGFACPLEQCPEMLNTQDSMLRSTTTADAWYKAAGDEIAETLLNDFKSSYVVASEVETPLLNDVMNRNSHFKKVYGEGKAHFIYKVLP
jgi:hypothetical protein